MREVICDCKVARSTCNLALVVAKSLAAVSSNASLSRTALLDNILKKI